MKHFEIKNIIGGAGGGGGSDPKPPTLKPPIIGDYSVAASYSYSEVIDLLSDGPIEGLSNTNGTLLDERSFLQGIYLNDIPVETTNDGFVDVFVQQEGAGGSLGFDTVCVTGLFENSFRIISEYPDALNNVYSLFTQKSDYSYAFNQNNTSSKSMISIMHDTTPSSTSSADALKDHSCVDITSEDGFFAVCANYSNNTIITADQSREDYANKYNYFLGGTNIVNNPGESNQTAALFKADKAIPGSITFFEKECPNLYTEICLQLSNFQKSTNSSINGIKRNKISEGINILRDIEADTQELTYNRHIRKILKDRLISFGMTESVDDNGLHIPFTRGQMVSFFKEKGKVNTNLTTNFLDWIFPYIFVSPTSGQVIEGYNAEDHLNIFKTEAVQIEKYDPSLTYKSGDKFYFQGFYYEIVYSSGGGSRSISGLANPTTSQYVIKSNQREQEVKSNIQLYLDSTYVIDDSDAAIYKNKFSLLIPNLAEDRTWDGTVFGFYFAMLDIDASVQIQTLAANAKNNLSVSYLKILLANEELQFLRDVSGFKILAGSDNLETEAISKKYNYSNVFMEFRNGSQNQTPLGYFKDIFIDHFYNSALIGPFNTYGILDDVTENYNSFGVQRLYKSGGYSGTQLVRKNSEGIPRTNFAANRVPTMDETFLLAVEESSADSRNADGRKDYATWNKTKVDFDEKAQPITHIIQNPNVESCFFTLSLQQLSDTSEKQKGSIEAGKRVPAILNIRVEVGLINELGDEIQSYDRFFQIVALVESANYMDIGNPDNIDSISEFKDIREVETDSEIYQEGDRGGIYTPFDLPKINREDFRDGDTSFSEDLDIKRYIRVTKLSVETNSTLLKRQASFVKVTEIIKSQCTYPFSALVGIKTDSRSFQDIPKRTYRAKLKKIKVPSNYFPTYGNSVDKRYYKKESDFTAKTADQIHIYKGDWDGTFKFIWSDNPAWVLYDMLTAVRYGLGEQIDESEVNKWELYKIARFCDAVDKDGYFEGVPDGRGGIEPRFSCNIVFSKGIKIFDAINSIAAIFRGIVYFQNGAVSFSDDRLKEPIALFTNANVKDGLFSYSSFKRDEKFNAVEVAYKDRNDSFKSKIEYVEDEQDIVKRGLFKKEIVASGITSKAMARRAAKHLMYQTTKEAESVNFTAGIEVLLCKPGDLVLIEDELKTLRTNFGRVLEVDVDKKSIRTSESFNTNNYEKKLTLYIPTGIETKESIDQISDTKRLRVTGLTIRNSIATIPEFDDNFNGDYKFSGYSEGYTPTEEELNTRFDRYQEYAVYTGENESKPIIWFNTGVTGWVFSTGQAFQDNEEYDKFIVQGTGVFYFTDLTTNDNEEPDYSGAYYSTGFGYPYRRSGAALSFQDKFLYNDLKKDLDYFGGVVENEVSVNGAIQIRTFDVTGWGGVESINKKDYGDIIYIDENDINANLLQFVPEGTVYRFQAKQATDQVYKINSIKEEDNYSYIVAASKYESGKYASIESEQNIDEEENTFGYISNDFVVNETNFIKLKTPEPVLLTGIETTGNRQGDFFINGQWPTVEFATGYIYSMQFPNGAELPETITGYNDFIIYNPPSIGNYSIKVQALADKFNNIDYNKRYDDSDLGVYSTYIQPEYIAPELEGTLVGNASVN